jgi:hypothetical protein
VPPRIVGCLARNPLLPSIASVASNGIAMTVSGGPRPARRPVCNVGRSRLIKHRRIERRLRSCDPGKLGECLVRVAGSIGSQITRRIAFAGPSAGRNLCGVHLVGRWSRSCTSSLEAIYFDFVDHLRHPTDPGHNFLGNLLFVEAKQPASEVKNAVFALARDPAHGLVRTYS